MFCIHPWPNSLDPSITGHLRDVHMSEDDETCLYCCCDVTRSQGVKPKLAKNGYFTWKIITSNPLVRLNWQKLLLKTGYLRKLLLQSHF